MLACLRQRYHGPWAHCSRSRLARLRGEARLRGRSMVHGPRPASPRHPDGVMRRHSSVTSLPRCQRPILGPGLASEGRLSTSAHSPPSPAWSHCMQLLLQSWVLETGSQPSQSSDHIPDGRAVKQSRGGRLSLPGPPLSPRAGPSRAIRRRGDVLQRLRHGPTLSRMQLLTNSHLSSAESDTSHTVV